MEAVSLNQLFLGACVVFFVLLFTGAAQSFRELGRRQALEHTGENYHEVEGQDNGHIEQSKRKAPKRPTNPYSGFGILDFVLSGDVSIYVPKGRKRA